VDTAVRGDSFPFRRCRAQLKDQGQCNALWGRAVQCEVSEIKMASPYSFSFEIKQGKLGLHTVQRKLVHGEQVECMVVYLSGVYVCQCLFCI
jgi:hypothetical protein